VDSAPFHVDITNTYQNAIINKEDHLITLAAPRGHAKSVWLSLILPIWCLLYGYKKYVIIISDSSEQADSFLECIRTELEENVALLTAFGSQRGGTSNIWHSTKLSLLNGGQVQSLGVGKKLRGARKRENRPDLVILDDVENDENVESLEQRNKYKRWFNRAVMNAGDRSTHYVTVGTILHHDSLLADLTKNPGFKTRKYKAITAFNTSPRWQEWERIFIDLDNPNHKEDALTYFKEHEKEMLKGTRVLWSQKESYYELMINRLTIGAASFNAEKQNEPINEEDCLFNLDFNDPRHWFDFDDIDMNNLIIRGANDPSMGKHMDRGDYSALITGGKDSAGYIYILDADIKRRHPDVIIDDMISKARYYKYNLFGIEEVAFQEYFKDAAIKRVRTEDMDVRLPIIGVPNTTTKKKIRIQSLQPLIANGTIKFHKSQKKLIEQLRFYPKVDHDDGPDALEMLVRLFKGSGDKLTVASKGQKAGRRGFGEF